MFTTTTFRRAESQLPGPATTHQPGCESVTYMASGLYGLAVCDCLLSPDLPLNFYRTRLTADEADVWYGHFSSFVPQGGEDEEDMSDKITWQEISSAVTVETAHEVALATASGLFDRIEAWIAEGEEEDGAAILMMGIVYLSLDPDDDSAVYFPIALDGTFSFNVQTLSRPAVPQTPFEPNPTSYPASYAPVQVVEEKTRRPWLMLGVVLILLIVGLMALNFLGVINWN